MGNKEIMEASRQMSGMHEIAKKIESEGKRMTDRDGLIRNAGGPRPKRAEDVGATHYTNCWRDHYACAMAEIERLRAEDAYNTDIIARLAEKLKQAEAELARGKAGAEKELTDTTERLARAEQKLLETDLALQMEP